MNVAEPQAIAEVTIRHHAGLAVRYLRPSVQNGHAPLLFLHGICSSGDTLLPLAEKFCAIGFECYVPTLHGDSVAENITSVIGIIRSIGETVTVIAHSEGCVVGSHAVNAVENLVNGVVMITPPTGILPMRWGPTKVFPVYVPRLFASALTGEDVQLNPADVAGFFVNGCDTKGFDEMSNVIIGERPFVFLDAAFGWHRVTKTSVPTLIIGADEDSLVRTPNRLAKKIGAEFVTVPSNHMVPLGSCQDKVVEIVKAWVGKNDTALMPRAA